MRTVVATLIGGLVGTVASFYAVGQIAWMLMADEPGSTRGLAGIGAAIIGGAVGAFLGAAGALMLAFRHEPAATRRTTVLVLLIAGPPLFGLVAVGAAQVDQSLNLPPAWLAVVLPATAVAGRWVALRRRS